MPTPIVEQFAPFLRKSSGSLGRKKMPSCELEVTAPYRGASPRFSRKVLFI
jgi:hypothetical protein